MILEVMEQEVMEVLELCSKEEVIEIMMALAVKRNPKILESSEEGPKQDAIMKLGLFMVMYHLNGQARRDRK